MKLLVLVSAAAAGLVASLALAGGSSTQAEVIGFQSGIDASVNAWIARDPSHKAGYEKLRRTLKILAADHDAAIGPPPPPPTETTPPPPQPLPAPQTYNKGSSGQDARYCVNGGAGGTDAAGYRYDSGGREIDGRRTGNPVPGLKPADQMDGREPCDPYTHGDRSFPPWPAQSYEV